MWKSPYIWIRHSPDADGGWEHQHEHQNPISGRPDWAYVKMHNGGLKATGVLELRMAKASTGLAWPSSWTWVESATTDHRRQHYENRRIRAAGSSRGRSVLPARPMGFRTPIR